MKSTSATTSIGGRGEPRASKGITLRRVWTDTPIGRIHARVGGGALDGPPVVLVHGMVISSRYMVPTALELATLCPVYAVDLPGYGDSVKPLAILGLPELADTLAAWMDAMRFPAAHLVANSFGCQVLAEFALRHDHRVDRLVFQDRARRRHLLHAGGQVGGLTDRRVIHVQVRPDGTDDDRAGVEPHADLDGHPVRTEDTVPILRDGLLHPQRRVARPHRVILVGQGRPEERHDAVAHHLIHGALVVMDGVHHQCEHGIEELARLLGVAVGEELHGALEVGEEDGDLLALAFEGGLGSEDLLGEMLPEYDAETEADRRPAAPAQPETHDGGPPGIGLEKPSQARACLAEWSLYILRVALVSRSTDKVPSQALSIPWCAFHRPERPFRFAFLVGLGLARVRRATTRRSFRLAGFDSAGAGGFASGTAGVGVVSSGQNFLVLSVTRMCSMVCRPLLSSSVIAVSVTLGGTSRSTSKKVRKASSPSTRCRPGPLGTNTTR